MGLRVSYPSLENTSTAAGEALSSVAPGDAAAGKKVAASLIATDVSGNLRYPLVDSQRRLSVVTNVNNEACLWERGEHGAGSGTFVTVTGAEITLVPDLEYHQVGFIVSCTRDAHFQIVQLDDVTETILADIILEGGQSTHSDEMHCLDFVAGSTGDQTLRLVAKNLNSLSALRGTIVVSEIQP